VLAAIYETPCPTCGHVKGDLGRKVAAACGVTETAASVWLRRRHPIPENRARQISEAFKIPLDELVEEVMTTSSSPPRPQAPRPARQGPSADALRRLDEAWPTNGENLEALMQTFPGRQPDGRLVKTRGRWRVSRTRAV